MRSGIEASRWPRLIRVLYAECTGTVFYGAGHSGFVLSQHFYTPLRGAGGIPFPFGGTRIQARRDLSDCPPAVARPARCGHVSRQRRFLRVLKHSGCGCHRLNRRCSRRVSCDRDVLRRHFHDRGTRQGHGASEGVPKDSFLS